MDSKLERAITSAVIAGVQVAAANPETSTTRRDVPTISNDVINAVAPIVAHATNTEPWYQSRVTWGAVASIALPLLGLAGVGSDVIDADTIVTLGLALGTVAGGVLTLYGRWKAKKPLGS